MARDDVYIARYGATIPAISEGSAERARINRRAELVVVDLWTQFNLDGVVFHMQIGTRDADAGVDSTTVPADTLVWMLADNNAGYVLIPARAQLAVKNWTTATLMGCFLEADKEKKRYSSGGTAFTPENLNGLDRASFNGSAYVGTDITALAKSAVPDSVEFAHLMSQEDAQLTPDVAATAPVNLIWDAKMCAAFPVLVDAASLLYHFGATTADLNGYGLMQFVQIPKSEIAAT